jgi:hypothetical protein
MRLERRGQSGTNRYTTVVVTMEMSIKGEIVVGKGLALGACVIQR